MKSNTNKLGAWIRQCLSDIGKNQVWLAEKIGVQAPQVSRIISGSSEATPDLLSAIADALGKPRIQAYRAAGYLEPLPEFDEWVEEQDSKLRKLSQKTRSFIGKIIDSAVENEEAEQKQKTKVKPAKA